jgi:hypothetical protein
MSVVISPGSISPGQKPLSHARVYRELGLARLDAIGLVDHGLSVSRPRVIFRDRFIEDFTTNLQGWSVSREARPVKSGSVLLLRPRRGATVRLSKVMRPAVSVRDGIFSLEARSLQPAAGMVVFYVSGRRHETTFALSETFTRRMFELPDGDLERIEIELTTNGHAAVRISELTRRADRETGVMVRAN